MKLEGKVINFLGDSITEGHGTSCEEKRFTNLLEKMYGLKANNYGIGGTRISRQQVVTEIVWDRDYCMRCEEMDTSADAVVVFGGTNDFGHGTAKLGTMADRDPSTFYGACHYLMDRLLTLYVGKPIVFITPLHRMNENDPFGDNMRSFPIAPLSEYRRILMEVAAYYGIPVLDLYAESCMQPHNQVVREALMPDGLHPNDAGHAILAQKIGQFLQYRV